jgi:hypothetical protein
MIGSHSVRRTTDAARYPVTTAALLLALVEAIAGCQRRSPPSEPFAVELSVPLPAGKPVPEPPPKALEAWRVWVNQEQPRQKKNPVWIDVPGNETRVLDMAEDGRWRCVVNPVRLRGQADEDGSVEAWALSRTARCSSDGWKTHVESLVRTTLDATGKLLQADPIAPIFLNDVVDGQPRRTIVLLEALGSPRSRTGPPPR